MELSCLREDDEGRLRHLDPILIPSHRQESLTIHMFSFANHAEMISRPYPMHEGEPMVEMKNPAIPFVEEEQPPKSEPAPGAIPWAGTSLSRAPGISYCPRRLVPASPPQVCTSMTRRQAAWRAPQSSCLARRTRPLPS